MSIDKRIILASASPRRKEILETGGIDFEVVVSDCEENTDLTCPDDYVMSLASLKAADVSKRFPDRIVLGADTVVVNNGNILGKPKDRDDAFKMIEGLSGRIHRVYTGVAFCIPLIEGIPFEKLKDELVKSTFLLGSSKPGFSRMENAEGYVFTYNVCTEVEVLELNKTEIEKYLDTGESFDKAGGYAVQGRFAPYIKGLKGDYYNVVGLPVCSVYHVLQSIYKFWGLQRD